MTHVGWFLENVSEFEFLVYNSMYTLLACRNYARFTYIFGHNNIYGVLQFIEIFRKMSNHVGGENEKHFIL